MDCWIHTVPSLCGMPKLTKAFCLLTKVFISCCTKFDNWVADTSENTLCYLYWLWGGIKLVKCKTTKKHNMQGWQKHSEFTRFLPNCYNTCWLFKLFWTMQAQKKQNFDLELTVGDFTWLFVKCIVSLKCYAPSTCIPLRAFIFKFLTERSGGWAYIHGRS